jgi:hypothetical protein
MTARAAVADGTIGITNEERGALDKRLDDLKRRLREGTLPFQPVMDSLQQIIEGKFLSGGGLLEFIKATPLDAIDTFIAADKFKVGAFVGGRKISWIGDNFKKHCLPVVEKNVPAVRWNAWRLAKPSRDPAIIATLGNEKATSKLAYVFQVMALGENGPSLTNGWANIAYIPSVVDGELWAGGWGVGGGGWRVEAYPVSCPVVWGGARRVFGG